MAANLVDDLAVATLNEEDIAVYQVKEKTGKMNFLFFNNGEKVARAGEGGMKAGSALKFNIYESDDRATWTSLTAAGAATAVVADATGGASEDLFTDNDHGLTDNDIITFSGTAVPTGIVEGQEYYVIDATTNTFRVSATKGGAAVDFSDDGTSVTYSTVGTFIEVAPGGTEDAAVMTNKRYIKVTGKGVTGPGYCRLDIQHRGDPYFGQLDIDLIAKSGYGKDGQAATADNGIAVYGADAWPE